MAKNGTEYITLKTNIKNKCRQAKNELHNEKSTEIERMSFIDMAGVHKRINK